MGRGHPGIGRVIGIIPARGGSKGVPRKNLAVVGGRTLIERSVAVVGSVVDDVVVSTDDAEIADVAAGAGATVHRRPDRLGGDLVTSEAVLVDVLHNYRADPGPWFIFAQATSPFTTPELVRRVAEALEAGADTAFSAVRFHDRLLQPSGGLPSMSGANTDVFNAPPPRHLRPCQWRETGAVYGIRTAPFLLRRARLFGQIEPVPADLWRSVDIDEPADLEAARALAGILDPSPLRT